MNDLSIPHWNNQSAFQALCNIIVSDRLVCLTGAGISRSLKRKSEPTKTVPGWWELLDELRKKFPLNDPNDAEDIRQLLSENAPGEWLIQAATILRNSHKNEFDQAIRDAVEVTNDPAGSTSDVHRAIAELKPRGIMTFNYDMGHENATELSEWKVFTPQNEEIMLELMRTDFAKRFILKAHGSLDSNERLILDFESYRELLAKSPTYRAFVGWLLTHFNVLIVGFGMSDPDFDEFMRLISVEIGGPVREHVLLTKATVETPEHILLRRRYGISILRLGDWSEIPEILKDALNEPGDKLREALKDCTAQDTSIRQEAHRALLHLSVPGRLIVSATLRKKIAAAMNDRDVRVASELIYSLGKLGRDATNKAFLLGLLDPNNHREIVAHAALALDGKLDPEDTSTLEQYLEKHAPEPKSHPDPKFPDPDNRIPIYLAYLIVQNRRRTAEKQPETVNEPMPFAVTVQPRKR